MPVPIFPGLGVLKTGNRIKWCFHCFSDSYSAVAETPTSHLCLRQSLGSPWPSLHGPVSPTFLGLLPISHSRHLASLKVLCSLSFVKPVGRNPQTRLSPQESPQPPPPCVQGWRVGVGIPAAPEVNHFSYICFLFEFPPGPLWVYGFGICIPFLPPPTPQLLKGVCLAGSFFLGVFLFFFFLLSSCERWI